jgi:nitroreductase
VLENRRAVRAYKKQSISEKKLSTMLKAAIEGDDADWPSTEYRAKVELLVVAWRVEGLPQGIYRYVPASYSLALVGAAPNQEAGGRDLVLQTEFADAAAIVLVTGELGAAVKQHGPWGHRNLLVRAGAAGYRLWLAALAMGLSGTVFAGLLPRAAQRLAGLDGYRRAGLFAYAVGYAADS